MYHAQLFVVFMFFFHHAICMQHVHTNVCVWWFKQLVGKRVKSEQAVRTIRYCSPFKFHNNVCTWVAFLCVRVCARARTHNKQLTDVCNCFRNCNSVVVVDVAEREIGSAVDPIAFKASDTNVTIDETLSSPETECKAK